MSGRDNVNCTWCLGSMVNTEELSDSSSLEVNQWASEQPEMHSAVLVNWQGLLESSVDAGG